MNDPYRVATATLALTASLVAQNVGAVSDNPYSQPDPYGASAIARIGYPAARDQAASLVRGDFLDILYEVQPAMISLSREAGTPGADAWRRCPQGGKVIASYTEDADNAANQHWSFQFAGCKFEDRVVNGGLEADGRNFNNNAYDFVSVFDHLSVRGPGGKVQIIDMNGFGVRGSVYLPVRSDCRPFPGANYEQDRSILSSVTVKRNGVVTKLGNVQYFEFSRQAQDLNFGFGDYHCKVGPAFSFEGYIESIRSAAYGPRGASVTIDYNSRRNKYDGDTSDRTGGAMSMTFGDGSGFSMDTPNARDGLSNVYVQDSGATVSFVDDEYRYRPRSRR